MMTPTCSCWAKAEPLPVTCQAGQHMNCSPCCTQDRTSSLTQMLLLVCIHTYALLYKHVIMQLLFMAMGQVNTSQCVYHAAIGAAMATCLVWHEWHV